MHPEQVIQATIHLVAFQNLASGIEVNGIIRTVTPLFLQVVSLSALDLGTHLLPSNGHEAAARMVGQRGVVYALDNQPLHIAILWFRTRLRRLRNIKLIFSDAKVTGLSNESIDVVFVCDAFHEFGDKKGTLEEFHRILKAGGVLSMWGENEGKMKKLATLITSTILFTVID